MKKLLYYLSLVLTAVNFIGIFAALMVAIYAPLFWNFMYDTDRLNESISQVYVEHLASTCRIVSIVVLVIMLVLIKPISTMRQKSRLSTKYDKYGRLKDDVYEKRSVKEQKKLDAQRFADMNRIIPATVVKQMTKKGSRNPEDDVAKLVGMRQVKNKIEEMAATMEFWKENDKHRGKQKEMTNHMVFFGPPGTGKTTVARIMTGFLYKYGYIEHNELIETGGSFFTTGNASMKADALCQLAYGRVLFIDEAYAMTEGGEGAEAVATIIKQMEDARGNFVLILADYADEIKALIKSNPKSIPESTFDFPKLFKATSAVILSNNILTFDIFLNPSIKTACIFISTQPSFVISFIQYHLFNFNAIYFFVLFSLLYYILIFSFYTQFFITFPFFLFLVIKKEGISQPS